MAVPPPRHDHSDNSAPGNTPALPESADDKNSARVVDAEIVDDNDDHRRQRRAGTAWNGNSPLDASDLFGGGTHDSHEGQQRFQGRFFYRGSFGQSGNLGGFNFGRVWTGGGQDQFGCLPPCVTFALFMVCLAQFGFFSGLGFVFFHTIGAVVGVVRDLRQFSTGRVPNPWIWRAGNWAVSFFLTAWISGAFH